MTDPGRHGWAEPPPPPPSPTRPVPGTTFDHEWRIRDLEAARARGNALNLVLVLGEVLIVVILLIILWRSL